ncbi:MAG: hypothetical protein MOB07_31310 [Acidobacteria bacterium]|nr:hypothetical protein [Acidobacteriota bacterium]
MYLSKSQLARERIRFQPWLGATLAESPPPIGTFSRVEYEVNQILADPNAARRWGTGPQGNLLSSDLRIRHPSSANNLFRPASAFNGANKCNVFALDIAWRSGFRVPPLNIGTSAQPRYSYPLANSLTTYAERAYGSSDISLRGSSGTQWGWVWTPISAVQINDEITQGFMYILVGWRRSGTGHVGIIRRIISKTDDTGRIRDITYDGWEATSTGARAFNGRRWRTDQCGQLTAQCQRDPGELLRVFCAIHIVGMIPELDPTRRGVLTRSTNRCRLR